MKRIIKYVISFLVICICTFIIGGNSIAIVQNTQNVKDKIISGNPYKLQSSNCSTHKITKFPIIRDVFNSDQCYFCAQHGTAYGGYGKTSIGNYYSFQVTIHKTSGYNKGKEDDMPSSSNYFWLNKNNNLNKTSYTSTDYDYKDGRNTITDIAYTNWVYTEKTISIACNKGNDLDSYKAEGTSKINDVGLAFLLAIYQGEGKRSVTYTKDPLQHAVWEWLGQYSGSEYEPIARKYSQYHSDAYSTELNKINITPGDGNENADGIQVNSVLSGSNYKIGPFTMGDYARAMDYSFTSNKYTSNDSMTLSKDEYDALPESEKSQYAKTKNGTYVERSTSDVKQFSGTVQSAMLTNPNKKNSQGDTNSMMVGDIIKVVATVSNGNSAQDKEITITDYFNNYNYNGNKTPAPNEVGYYLKLKDSDIEGYDELKYITFTYRRVHTGANGYYYDGKQKILSFKSVNESAGCGSYHCNGCYCSGGHKKSTCHACNCTNDRCVHDCKHRCGDACKTKCTHKCDSGCYHRHSCSGHTYSNGGNCPDKGHCACDRNHSQGYIGPKGDQAVCNDHNYKDCRKFNWKYNGVANNDVCQNGVALRGELLRQDFTYKVDVSVPLKTNVNIYKYISKVEHVGDTGEISVGDRSGMSKDEKIAAPVFVERGDKISYTVRITNSSRFPTRVKVEDILPDNCSAKDYKIGGNGIINDLVIDDEIKNSEWIPVDAGKTVEFIITLRPITNDLDTHTNLIKFITLNNTSPKMQYTSWGSGSTNGEHTNSSIVNIGTRLEDADSYKVKAYNINVEKYIQDVQHAFMNGSYDSSLTAQNTRLSKSESDKKSQQVYVEYGDVITYKIVLYNTIDSYSGFNNRNNSPYKNPDKAYVSLTDVLPLNYNTSDIEVTMEASDKSSQKTICCYDGNVANKFISSDKKKLNFKDILVPANGTTTITIKLRVEDVKTSNEKANATIRENKVTINGYKNINYSPSRNQNDQYCVINNYKPIKTTSSDFYIINHYNAGIDKYIYSYNESENIANRNNRFTYEDYIANDINYEFPQTNKGIKKLDDKYKRNNLSDQNKLNNPLSVEKNEYIQYAIVVKNEQSSNKVAIQDGVRPGTQIRPTRVTDIMQKGLTYNNSLYPVEATIFYSNGKVKNNKVAVKVTTTKEAGTGNMIIYFDIDESYVLDPGEYISYIVTVQVTESNMYLYKLENTAKLTTLTNINHTITTSKGNQRIIKNEAGSIDSNYSQESSSDYVRMKDLVISGKVWLDLNRDGKQNENLSDYASKSGFTKDKLKLYYNIDDNSMKKEIVVKLYRVYNDEEKLVRTTLTDKNGLFTFAKDENLNNYSTINTAQRSKDNELLNNYNSNVTYQRIDKADGKDANGNYKENSKYYSYYIEYEYDGVLYKSTEKYAGTENLTSNDGGITDNYKIDSNAKEFTNVRENYNKNYEYITYDAALNDTLTTSSKLEFDKTNHTSQLLESNNRIITSRSFIMSYKTDEVKIALDRAMNSCGAASWKTCSNHYKHWQTLISLNIIDPSKYPNTTAGRQAAQAELRNIKEKITTSANANGYSEMAKLLFLYSFNNSVDNTIPKTDYLKYINLGLELREDVDVTLTKDVYKVTTTLNGEEIEYDFNQNSGINGEMGNGANNSYLKDYISNSPYGIELYESDFKQRIEQYEATAVRDYKGIESELNVEVTYRISINNNATTDDDNANGATDTKLKVKISEILDLYDQAFKKYIDGEANVVNVRQMNSTTGMYGEDRKVAYAEAWYYKKLEGNDLLNKDITRYTISNDTAYKSGEKPIYIQNNQGEYKKIPLNVSQKSKNEKGVAYTTKENNFLSDGYNTLYITGMNGEYIDEGSSLDIYVKYVLDKSEESVEVTNETLKTEIKSAYNKEIEGDVTFNNQTYHYKVGESGSSYSITTKLNRTLKIVEKIDNEFKNKYGRGIENVAQVNAYSVWYANNNPTSIVDKDSNAGNIGNINSTITRSGTLKTIITNGGTGKDNVTSGDNIDFYEDTAYKTGVELMAEGTGVTLEKISEISRYPDWFKGKLTKSLVPNRTIEGTVWDDSRTDTLGTSNNDTQYIGDGKLDTSKSKNTDAKSNENVNKNYKDGKQTEDKDLLVRNAKAEYIEIVQTKDDQYYEQKLKNVIWPAIQSSRTDENGKYVLEGMIPGRYIVRFTYGDIGSEITTVDNNVALSDVQKDNLIFNGQDYKSTLNNLNLDGELDDDKILTKLQEENISDARDDEIRRLEVNAYSEVMTSSIAEILKGLANGSITRNSQITNTADQLNELSSKTAMQAETVEFLVKPEKPEKSSVTYKSWDGKISIRTGQGLKDDKVDVLYKELVNMDFNDSLDRIYAIKNIDLGVEYRPEAEITLEKEIEEIKLITTGKQGDEPLVDLHFVTVEENGNKVHKIVEDKSKGFDLVQFGTNDYTKLLSNLDTEEFQGYVYIQIDPEILQGSRVEISYKFIVQNHSEIDRIRDTLNYMRMKNNPAVNDYTESDITLVNSDRYTASETARNILYKEIYKDIADKDAFGNAVKTVFRNRKKELVNTSLDTTTNALQKEDYKGGYFGKFVGYSYYAGKLDDTYKDVISELKFDKILDYVDTDLEYDATVNGNDLENKYWAKTTTAELEEYVLRARKMAGTTLNDSSVNTNGSPSTDLDIKNSNAAKLNMTNVSGVIYDNLVVSVSNRLIDSVREEEPNTKKITYKIDSSTGLNEVYNKDMDKFMTPVKYDEANSKGTVYLPVSKVQSSQTDTNNMSYENIAEIIQYTVLTGRRTNFATTVGNADITTVKDIDPDYEKKGSEEFATASFEADTAGTETITFTPPTGLMKNRKVIVNAVETAKVGVGVIATGVAVVFVGIFVTNFAIRKYKKRRIK